MDVELVRDWGLRSIAGKYEMQEYEARLDGKVVWVRELREKRAMSPVRPQNRFYLMYDL